jgi:small-conductance mechanosensitive channel
MYLPKPIYELDITDLILADGALNATSTWLGIPDRINALGTEISLLTIIIAIAIVIGGILIAHVVRLLTAKYMGAHLPANTRKTTSKLVYYLIIAIALLSALGISGLDFSGIFLAGGIAGIVIGFATQSLFSNLISGMFLQIDKPMRIGDPVLITGKLPDVAGIVVEVTTLSSRLRMFDGTYVRLPNSDVFLSEIRNYSGAAARRVEIAVGVAYKEDVDKVMDIIRKNLQANPLVLVEPEPDIYVKNLGDSAVNINVWCWVPFSVWFDMKKLLLKQIKQELDNNRIEMPFPQMVVYMGTDTKKAGGARKPAGTAPEDEVKEKLSLQEYTQQEG